MVGHGPLEASIGVQIPVPQLALLAVVRGFDSANY